MWRKKSNGDKIFDIMLIIISIAIIIVIAYPLYFVIIASFSKPEAVLGGKLRFLPVGFNVESYKMVLSERKVWIGYRNTLLYTVLGTSINLLLTILAAYALSRKDMPWRTPLTFIISFTMLFGGGMIPVYMVVKNLGLTDTIWAMVIPNAIATYNLLVMKNYFQSSIPEELQEAAAIDGASPLQRFKAITLPLISGAFTINLTLSLINGLKVFDQISVMTDGGPGFTTETIVYLLYKVGFNEGRQGFGTAVGIVLLFIILILNAIQQSILKRREVQL